MSKIWVVAAFAMLGWLGSARAEPPAVSLHDIPAACDPFTHAPRDPTAAWNQLLSLGGCLRHGHAVRITDSAGLERGLDELANAEDPSVAIFVFALQHGPDRIRIRAAYEIGATLTQLVVRARRSIEIPPTVSAERSASLHAELEPIMAEALAAARGAFASVDEAARTNPELVDDPVLQYIVVDSRRMLRLLPAPADARGDTLTAD